MEYKDGVYRILYIKVGTEYQPVGCLSNNSFNESSESLSTTTRDNTDGWETSIPTTQRFDIPFDGLVSLTADTGLVTYRDIEALKRDRTKIEWKIENSYGDDVDYGEGYIFTLSKSSPIGEFESFTSTITGYGKPLILTGNLYIDSDYVDDYYV